MLLSCSQLQGRHTAENIISEFEEVVTHYKISDKVFRVVTDNGSNVKKAFLETIDLPEFMVEGDSEDEDGDIEEERDSEDEDRDIEEEGDNFGDSSDGSKVDEKLSLPQRVPCFAHTLQLCVKDGLKASSPIAAVLHKAGRIVSHCRKSTLATDKAEELFGKTVIAKNETRWNTQLKMVR